MWKFLISEFEAILSFTLVSSGCSCGKSPCIYSCDSNLSPELAKEIPKLAPRSSPCVSPSHSPAMSSRPASPHLLSTQQKKGSGQQTASCPLNNTASQLKTESREAVSTNCDSASLQKDLPSSPQECHRILPHAQDSNSALLSQSHCDKTNIEKPPSAISISSLNHKENHSFSSLCIRKKESSLSNNFENCQNSFLPTQANSSQTPPPPLSIEDEKVSSSPSNDQHGPDNPHKSSLVSEGSESHLLLPSTSPLSQEHSGRACSWDADCATESSECAKSCFRSTHNSNTGDSNNTVLSTIQHINANTNLINRTDSGNRLKSFRNAANDSDQNVSSHKNENSSDGSTMKQMPKLPRNKQSSFKNMKSPNEGLHSHNNTAKPYPSKNTLSTQQSVKEKLNKLYYNQLAEFSVSQVSLLFFFSGRR